MIRVSDYIARTLAERGITNVFMVTGGGAMHLNDAFGRCRGVTVVPCHHEQACATAAESHFRMTGRMACANVTTGPGGTNAITGVYGAWVDSMAMIVVSGQVKWETTVRSTGLPLRQLGDQEIDIVPLVAPITKYAVMVTDPESIRYHLERALHLATQGRPGPVWLDVPMNVQGAKVDPESLRAYDPAEDPLPRATGAELERLARETLQRLRAAKRPVVFAGSGIRISGGHARFLDLVQRLGVPVVTAWNSHDLVEDENPCYAGRPGTIGDRAGNFAVQNSDFLLVLGCRLNIRQVSYNWRSFARAAYKVVVDIDPLELRKPTVVPDLPIQADAREFIEAMLGLEPSPAQAPGPWLERCREWRRRYPVVLPEYRLKSEPVNPYVFMEELFRALPAGARVVTGDGSACVVSFQAAGIKRDQRLYTNSGSAPMGYDLPAAIGASVALGRRPVVCLAGDGSLQMNVQELATVTRQRLPIKLFVLNNGGYHSIRQTQEAYFPDNPVGYDEASGVGFPDWEMLARAYGLGFRRIASHAGLPAGIDAVLSADGAVLCEVVLDPAQPFSPKLASRRLPDGTMVSPALEDMAPFLEREEFLSNLLVEPQESQ